jgi:putative membrane protein
MLYFIVRWVINAIALGVTALIVPGIHISGLSTTGRIETAALVNLFIVALIFGLVNAIIKPIVALATCPFYILTLGLFTFIVNALMLMLTSWLTDPRFVVDSFWWALLGSIVISVISTVLSAMVREDRAQQRRR